MLADLDRRRVVFATPGRDHSVYARFAEDLAADGGHVGEVCQDMSEGFLKGALEHLPDAEITFDRFRIKAQLTQAVDEARRATPPSTQSCSSTPAGCGCATRPR